MLGASTVRRQEFVAAPVAVMRWALVIRLSKMAILTRGVADDNVALGDGGWEEWEDGLPVGGQAE